MRTNKPDKELTRYTPIIPVADALLSGEPTRHIMPNDICGGSAENEADFDKARAWCDSPAPDDQERVRRAFWVRVIDYEK